MKKLSKKALAVLLATLMLCAIGAVSLFAKNFTALQWTWGLPQNILGAALYLHMEKYKTERFREAYVVYAKPFKLFGREMRGCVSLGNFIFVIGERYASTEEYIEYLEDEYFWQMEHYHWMLGNFEDYSMIDPPLDPSTLSESEKADLFRDYNAYESDNGIIYHEYGHTLQSAVLGPLYLFVIGAPSFLLSQGVISFDGGYRDFYTEHWADGWACAWLGKAK